MFLSADILVKAVIVGLIFASLVTWTLFLAKTIHLSLARRDLRSALPRIAKVRTLSEAQVGLGAAKSNVLLELLVAAAQQEAQLSDECSRGRRHQGSVRRHTSADLVRVEARARCATGMAIIATIGATAPFVGLFGTVWGIMNSFIGISKAANDQSRGRGAPVSQRLGLRQRPSALARRFPGRHHLQSLPRAPPEATSTSSDAALVHDRASVVTRSRPAAFHGRTAARAAELNHGLRWYSAIWMTMTTIST